MTLAAVTAGAVLTSLVAAAPATAAATGTVRGTVVDDAGAPVAGLVVSARTGSDAVLATTRTGTDGTYRLVAPAGDRAVCFDGTGVATASGGYRFTCFGGPSAARATPVHVVADRVRSGVDGTVTRRAVVTGRVSEGNSPLTGATVALAGGSDGVTTGSDGRYRLVLDPVDHPTVNVCASGAAATGGTSNAGYGAACRSDLALAPGAVVTADFDLAPAAGAAGRVTDSAGRPVAGAQVILPDVTVATRADGTWRATGTTPGPVQILVVPPTGAPGPTGHGVLPTCVGGVAPVPPGACPQAATLTLSTGRVTRGLDAVLPDGAEFSGRVTDDRGAPIPGVTVVVGTTLFDTPVLAETDARGQWDARGLPPTSGSTVCTQDGAVDVATPDPDGYSGGCVRSADGQPTQFTLTSGTGVVAPDLVLTGRGRVVGRIVDAVTGRGVAGVDVAVASAGVEGVTHVTSGPDGSWVVGHLVAGSNGVCAFAAGAGDAPPLGYADTCGPQVSASFLLDPQPFTVRQRGDTSLTIRLVHNGTLAGRVTDSAGFGLRGVQVEIQSTTTATSATVETGGNGRWASPGLPPGTYTVCFHGDRAVRGTDGSHPPNGYAYACLGGSSGPTPVTVSAGRARTGFDIVLAPNPTS